ncbi:MAG TPA: hypothetical protein P5567_10580, partial [Kiritimatiellia bacterium]|nr:hypothetical protein [Kiritimatiellia bacterium]HRZ12885.1 hypothetical protein [Kiritimatiellia bacterium]HSA18505.1 hypothetical protein [Kiritimatiellia bacterium]
MLSTPALIKVLRIPAAYPALYFFLPQRQRNAANKAGDGGVKKKVVVLSGRRSKVLPTIAGP